MDNNFVISGRWGECPWGITGDGELVIGGGQAETIAYIGAPWEDYTANITSARTEGSVSFPEGSSLMGLFKGCTNMEKADLSGFETGNVTDMSSMFEGCARLAKLDISTFDTHRCTDMRRMFGQCASLTEILLGPGFSTEGDGSTACDKLAIKQYGSYRKARTIRVDGFRVTYHGKEDEDETVTRNTLPEYKYTIEDLMFKAPSDKAVFRGWNTEPDMKGVMYQPGEKVDNIDRDTDLYAIWALPPMIREISQPRSFAYGEPIPFELPEIISVNDPEVSGHLEISRTGEEGSWRAIDRNTILPVAFNGYLIRLHASNSVGETVSNAVRLNIRKATLDMSSVRWVEDDDMVYNGRPKEIHLEGLPDIIKVSYEGNVAVNAGTYVAGLRLEYDSENFNEPPVIREHEWVIRKASFDMSEAHWDYSGPFHYDGTEKTVRLVGLPEGVTASYENNYSKDAGVYTAVASLHYDQDNFEKPSEIVPCVWEIKRALIDTRSIRWSSYDGFVYDGRPKQVYITNLPEDAVVEYNGSEEILAGKYLARATFTGNYAVSGPAEYEWEIEKARYDTSEMMWSGEDFFVYDGGTHEISLSGIPKELSVRYFGNSGRDAGIYNAKACFVNPDTHNYVTPEDMHRTWQILKKDVDMSSVHWDYTAPFTYDGETKSVQLTGLPEGIRAEYRDNTAFAAGSYSAHAILRYDENNLKVIHPADCQWKISKKRIDVSGIHWDYKNTLVYNGESQGVYLAGVPEGLSIEYSGNEWVNAGKYVASATLIPADKHNFEVPEINGCTWAIEKARLTLPALEWTEDTGFVYDGNKKTMRIISDLGEAIEVAYEDDCSVNAGSYYTRAIFSAVDEANFEPPQPVGRAWSISKAHYDMSGVVWDYDSPFTYDGTVKSVKLLNVPEGIIVTYKDASRTDAGSYVAVAQFDIQDSVNYEDNISGMTLEWSINKASFDMSEVKWQGDKEVVYDGTEKSIRLSGLPEGVLPMYSGNQATGAGEYTARASFEYDEKNYEEPVVAPCRWIIEKAPVDISGVMWDYENPFVHDGKEKSVSVTGLPADTRAEYSSAAAVEAGTYVAVAEIIPDDTDNLLKCRMENLTWRIERGEYDMSHAQWDYDKAFTYDGSEHSVAIKGLPEGVIPTYHGSNATDAGRYRATVSFDIVDRHNFNVPEFDALEWTINKADYDMSGASWDYEGEFRYTSRMYEITLRGLPEGVRAVYSGNAAADTGSYEAVADLIPYDQDNYNKPFIESCKWQITKADYEMSAVRWDYTAAKVFNGREQGVLLEHLPNGVTAEYYGNEATDVGSYSARAVLSVSDPANYNVPAIGGCDWEITRAEYDMRSAVWDYTEGKFVFDGESKTVQLHGLPEDVRATYKGNTASYVGTYKAVATFTTEDNNFNEPPEMSLEWSIEKADYDMSRAMWNYRDSFTYDGSPKRIELTGLPEGIYVEYTDNTATDAGIYTATAHFKSSTNDYNEPDDMTCTWMIEKADIDIRRLRWGYSQRFTYDGTEKSVELEGMPELLRAVYSGNSMTNAGIYTAHAKLIPVNPENYNTPSMMDCSWEIGKASYDMSHAHWEAGSDFVYDGEVKSVELVGLPNGVTPVYKGSSAADAGTYTASVEFIYDGENYYQPRMDDHIWSISKAAYDMSGVSWNLPESNDFDGNVKKVSLRGLPDGVTPVYKGSEAVDAGSYETFVDFEYDEVNYYKPEFGSVKWEIEPSEPNVDLSAICWDYDEPFVYDGSVKAVSLADPKPVEYKQVSGGLFSRRRTVPVTTEYTGPMGVPEGFEVVYDGASAVNAGVYYANARLVCKDNSNYKDLVLPPLRWEIVKAAPDMTAVRWNYKGAFVYDGTEKSVELTGLPDSVSVSYTDNIGVDAGDHEAMAVLDVFDSANYETPSPVSGCWWRIDKAVYDMSEVRWTYDDDIVYDGEEKSIKVAGLPEGVKVEAYRGNKAIEAGTYIAEVVLKFQNKGNYEVPYVPAQKWRIQKKKIDTSDMIWDYDESTLFVYDDKPKEVRLIGMPKDVDVIYVDNKKINAGTYTARARLVYDTHNFEADGVPDLRWKIQKARYDTSGAYWTYEKPFIFDGSEKSVALNGMPGSVSIRYRDNRASMVGAYTAKAYLTYDSENYEEPEIPATVDWEIVSGDNE